MALEGFRWFVRTEFAHVDTLIGRTRSKTDIRLPVDIKGWGGMETKLLRALTSCCIPNDCSLLEK